MSVSLIGSMVVAFFSLVAAWLKSRRPVETGGEGAAQQKNVDMSDAEKRTMAAAAAGVQPLGLPDGSDPNDRDRGS